MLRVLIKVLRGVLPIWWKHRKDGTAKKLIDLWVELNITQDDYKALRLGKVAFWLQATLVWALSTVLSWRNPRLAPLTFSGAPLPAYIDGLAFDCVMKIESDYKSEGMLVLDRHALNGHFGGLGDSAKWHGLYVASLWRMGYTDLFNTNLAAMKLVIMNGLKRHPAHAATWTPVSPDSMAGFAQALLVPHPAKTIRLRMKVYEHLVKTDFFLPHPDGRPGTNDLRPNLFSNENRLLAYVAVKIMGDALSDEDLWYLRQSLKAPPVAADTNVYGAHNNAMLADAIMCARPDTKWFLIPYLQRLLKREAGAYNPEILSILVYHAHRDEYRDIVLEQLGQGDAMPYKSGSHASGGFTDKYLPLGERRMQDYAWQRPANELYGAGPDYAYTFARLDVVAPYSRLVAAGV